MATDTHPSCVPAGEPGLTVAAACALYVADRRAEKGEACAHDACKRFERTVYGTAFGALAPRELFLDLAQRRALLEAAVGAVRDLIESVMLTGARAGELISATPAQFNARLQTMRFSGKTGARTVPLSGAAARAALPPGVCLYTLRHSFITQALSDGMTTLEVARLVGTSLAMIDKHYGHLVNHALRERLSRVIMR